MTGQCVQKAPPGIDLEFALPEWGSDLRRALKQTPQIVFGQGKKMFLAQTCREYSKSCIATVGLNIWRAEQAQHEVQESRDAVTVPESGGRGNPVGWCCAVAAEGHGRSVRGNRFHLRRVPASPCRDKAHGSKFVRGE